ncbi:MAG: SGNH/GDSL hydrolase family protein [Jatrophihabitans sp.]|nr:MAG: SGNH/GDSL hydrolase family protein [Jatrophihabitans sp.]
MHPAAAVLRGRRTPGWAAAAAGATLVALVAGLIAAGPIPPAGPPRSVPAAWDEPAVPVTVVGDSLSSGYRTPGDPWTVPAQALLDADGIPMTLTNASGPGSGYVAQGAGGATFADYVIAGVSARTRAVILFGSDNDLRDGAVPDGYADAVAATLRLVRAIAPAALVIVVGPPGTLANPAAGLTALDDTLGGVTLDNGAIFVDALDWFAGADAGYLGPDGEHPDVAGESYLAYRFVTLLTALRAGRENLVTRIR